MHQSIPSCTTCAHAISSAVIVLKLTIDTAHYNVRMPVSDERCNTGIRTQLRSCGWSVFVAF